MSARLLIAAAVAALALGLAACGDDDDSSSDGGTATEAAEGEVDNTDLKQKPVITTTGDESPGALIVEDIVVGKGPAAKSGDQISVQYVGALVLGRDRVRQLLGHRPAVRVRAGAPAG